MGGIDEYIERELNNLKEAYGNGCEGALQDALLICYKYQKRPPNWMFEALAIQGVKYLKGVKSKERQNKSGRPRREDTPWLERRKKDMIDYERAETVRECREHGFSWEDACEAASKILIGSYAAGGRDAMENSYKSCQKGMRENPSRYIILKTIRVPNDRRPIPEEVLQMKRKGRKQG